MHKILILKENSEVNIIDKVDNAIVKISNQSEQSFIDYGMSQSDLASIDMSADFTEKHYIQDVSIPLGEGKVFEQVLDMNKILKKVSIK